MLVLFDFVATASMVHLHRAVSLPVLSASAPTLRPLLSASTPSLRVAQPPVALLEQVALPAGFIAEKAALMQNAPVSFGALYFLCELLIPLNTGLAPIGGALYGFARGLAIVATASTAAAVAAFFIGRTFRERFTLRLRRSPAVSKQFAFIDRVIARGGFRALLLLRLIPTPIPAINFLYGLTSVAPHSYIVATAVGNLPGTAAIVSTGLFGKQLLTASVASPSHRAWCTQAWCAQPMWAYAAAAVALIAAVQLVANGVRSAKGALEALLAEDEEECAAEVRPESEELLELVPCDAIPDECRPWSSGSEAAVECAGIEPHSSPTGLAGTLVRWRTREVREVRDRN